MFAAMASACETVLGEINSRGAGVKIALIDASRRNPIRAPVPQLFRRPRAGHRAERHAGDVFGGALLRSSRDNGGDHSLFVRELLKEIRVPDLMAEETLNRTRVGVTRASRSEQVPWISSSLAEDFSFIRAVRARGPPRHRPRRGRSRLPPRRCTVAGTAAASAR